jgi:uncharacterized protein with GYD domain
MMRYAVLLRFTEKGIEAIQKSPARADAFRAAAAKVKARVEGQWWTSGSYDGILVFSAPDEETACALVLKLGAADCVQTTMLRAFDEAEFKGVLKKMK